MNSIDDDETVSDVFDIPNSIDTQAFILDSDVLKLSPLLNKTSQYDNYLRVTIGEPLIYALTYVLTYRPEDPIEFIASFLIDWSRKKLMDQETNRILISTEIYRKQCLIDEEQKNEAKRLLIERKEKQQEQIVFEYDKHLFTSYQWDFPINPRTDDEREPSSHYQEQKQEIHRQFYPTNAQEHIHIHDTASGFDDEKESNREMRRSRICNDGNLSSFTYFSKLKDRIIRCDET